MHCGREGGKPLAGLARGSRGGADPIASQLACSHPPRTTLECTYRTVGTVRRPFTPIRTLFAHNSHNHHIVFTAAHYSHSRRLFARSYTLFAHYSHGRTLFAHYSHGRTLFTRSHTIRNVRAVLSPCRERGGFPYAPSVPIGARGGVEGQHSPSYHESFHETATES